MASDHILSNIYLVQGENYPMIHYLMSYIPGNEIVWTEFYELGRSMSKTPFRYILSQPALKTAFYILLIGLLGFIFFEIKRKQRAIPIIKPPDNDSLQFVRTIGNLYFENGSTARVIDRSNRRLLS